jgi:hypothetical protein
MAKYDDTMAVIEDMARVKRTMNSHKGNIEDMSEQEILDCLAGEFTELKEATGMLNTIEEAADMYNFLMALVHKKITTYRERK